MLCIASSGGYCSVSYSLSKRLVAEGVGTAMLLAAIVGSGIMAERLAQGNTAIALLANAVATGAMLLALILTFGGISGAHFNPVITLGEATHRNLKWTECGAYVTVQFTGAFLGVVIAHLMFGLRLLSTSRHDRSGLPQVFSESVATFGLVSVIYGTRRQFPQSTMAVALTVAAYITAAYWFTSSTSFANPAVTVARSLTDTFVGIRPTDVGGFILGQLCGALAALVLFRWLDKETANGEN